MEEFDGDDEPRPEFLFPFRIEDIDVVGLCCHIDEDHTIEAKNWASILLLITSQGLFAII